MIIKEEVNGLIFLEQRTYRVYESEEDWKRGRAIITTSNEELFIANKSLAKEKEENGDSHNKFIPL